MFSGPGCRAPEVGRGQGLCVPWWEQWVLSAFSQHSQQRRQGLPGRNSGLPPRQWAHSQGLCCRAPWLPLSCPAVGLGAAGSQGQQPRRSSGASVAGMCLSRGPWKSLCQQQRSPPLLRGCRVWDRQYDSSSTHSEDAGGTAGQTRSSGTLRAEGHQRGAPCRGQRCAAPVSTARPRKGQPPEG